MTTLYIVGTPIGNLEDITLRALQILRSAEVILCEDTRVTKRLLDRHEISGKKLLSYNEQKSGVTAEKVIDILEKGENVALVTDAGTPGISDPGGVLIREVRDYCAATESEIKIIAVPGPSALTAALSISGIPVSDFVFLGFLPHKKGRETLFKEIADSNRTVIFYESPHRILKTLESLAKHLETERKVVIARELTKIYEEVVSGAPRYVLDFFLGHSDKVRGEFVVIVEGT